jgi:hypothetical protein
MWLVKWLYKAIPLSVYPINEQIIAIVGILVDLEGHVIAFPPSSRPPIKIGLAR